MYDPYGFPLRVPSKLLEELGAFTGKFWSSLDLEPIVCDLIRDYIKPASAPASQAPAAPSAQDAAQCEAGYQWKEVYLPAGTKLRASFGRKPYFAIVEGAEIMVGELAVSPSGFANLHGSGNRNAWKAIWLRLPGGDGWLLADVYRAARKAAIARLLAGEASPAGQPSPADTASKNAIPPVQAAAAPQTATPAARVAAAPQPAIPAARVAAAPRPATPAARAATAPRPAIAPVRPAGARQAVVAPAKATMPLSPALPAQAVEDSGSEAQRKKNAGRSARRKRRAAAKRLLTDQPSVGRPVR